jgi:small subunit ribosomal protein S18
VARNNDRDRGKRTVKDNRPPGKTKACVFCSDANLVVDYKDVGQLRRFMSDRGKIKARRATGTCAQHQREVQVAIKTARELALLPFAQRTISERSPGRGAKSGGRRGADTGASAAPASPSVHEPEEVDA